MRVTFNELATRELNDAAQYYEQEQSGLGAAFLNEVEQMHRRLSGFPAGRGDGPGLDSAAPLPAVPLRAPL